jgi:hypothetical protein
VEFVFGVSSGSRECVPVAVRVSGAALRAWEEERSRQLSSTEQYAIAKMALFQAFEERPTPARMGDDIAVRHADLRAILETLDL